MNEGRHMRPARSALRPSNTPTAAGGEGQDHAQPDRHGATSTPQAKWEVQMETRTATR